MLWGILFVFGLAIGSFLNVLALRYDGEHFVLDPKVVGGRSHCPHCGKQLRWFELVPLASFAAQRGRCRNCRARLSIQYPFVELLSGAVFAGVPYELASYQWLAPAGWMILSAFWIAAFEALLLIAIIDLRLSIIPDELTVFLGILAIFETVFAAAYLIPSEQSFLGIYAQYFGWYGNVWATHLIGAAIGTGFFAVLVAVTRGRGMGMGDVKLGAPLGFLFGWPDIAFLYGFAFIAGAIVGVLLILRKMKTMRQAVPFGPFLVAASAFVFFFGAPSSAWYFRIIGL